MTRPLLVVEIDLDFLRRCPGRAGRRASDQDNAGRHEDRKLTTLHHINDRFKQPAHFNRSGFALRLPIRAPHSGGQLENRGHLPNTGNRPRVVTQVEIDQDTLEGIGEMLATDADFLKQPSQHKPLRQ